MLAWQAGLLAGAYAPPYSLPDRVWKTTPCDGWVRDWWAVMLGTASLPWGPADASEAASLGR
jgi:hypothetical protein